MTDLSQLPEDCRYENPSCGDWVRVLPEVEDGIVKRISFDGEGCSLSIAAASMMTEYLKGMTVARAKDAANAFKLAVTSPDEAFSSDEWADLYAFDEIRAFPIRQKCVLLPFRAFVSELSKLK